MIMSMWNKVNCFEALKRALVKAPSLAYPHFKTPFDGNSDASDRDVAAILYFSYTMRSNKYIFYVSRRLTSTEQRYTTSERELLATTYHIYSNVFGRHIVVYTDDEPLVAMRQLKFANMDHTRLARLFTVYKKSTTSSNSYRGWITT